MALQVRQESSVADRCDRPSYRCFPVNLAIGLAVPLVDGSSEVNAHPTIKQDRIELLTALSTDAHEHSGRTLFDHLVHTSELLVAWGNPEQVCDAGLFHSIYGTAYYRVQSASLSRRGEVAAVIGERAEELAFLFCVTDRRWFFDQVGLENPALENRVEGTRLSVDARTIDALVEIEVANWVEQIDPTRVPNAGATSQLMLHRGGEHLSEGARAALDSLIDQQIVL